MRLARASSTDEALRTAYASSVFPPDSISTTREPARYSPSTADVMIENPASKSEPSSPRSSLLIRSTTSSDPPETRQTIKGSSRNEKRPIVASVVTPTRRIRWSPIAASASLIITLWMRLASATCWSFHLPIVHRVGHRALSITLKLPEPLQDSGRVANRSARDQSLPN